MKIGDKVWIFDNNRRRYTDDKGNKLDRCWYRGHFAERYVLGETKQSWIIGHEGSKPENKTCLKVNKKDMIVKGHALESKLYLCEEEIEQECWMNDNKFKIIDKLQRCNDYNVFKEVEELLNSKSN